MSKRNKKEKAKHQEENGEAWLLPYSDLMTLLLAVFIVLFAVSQVNTSKAQQLAEEFRKDMMTQTETVTDTTTDTTEDTTTSTSTNQAQTQMSEAELAEYLGAYQYENLEELKAEIDAKIASEGLTDSVTTSIDIRGLVISFSNAILFDSGSAEIRQDKESALLEIAEMISTRTNYIRIEGHTDNVPIRSRLYTSNWELSTARATKVVELFINKGNVSPEKLVAVGYGEYRPVADNSTIEGRSKNRRIDIIVLSDKYSDLEQQLIGN